tara:strand:- start:610 stop:1248 length:639 start_codon:yes stop_codon:yes gene_type:complete
MLPILPKDLKEAEKLISVSVIGYLNDSPSRFSSLNLLFENIRLIPIISRLAVKLLENNINFYLLWPDEGASALAKRDLPEFDEFIFSFSKFEKNINNINNTYVCIAVKPEPYDFDEFKKICEMYTGKIIMINGRLEDLAVGIGNLGRERRKAFISLWQNIFWLQPLSRGAIMFLYKSNWKVFRLDNDGYRYCKSFDIKPDDESINEAFKIIT